MQRAGQQGGLLSQREARLAAQCEQLQQQLATQLAAGAGSAAASEAQQRAAALAAELQQTKAAYAELKVQGDRLFERSREEIKKRTDRIRELKAEAQSGAEAQAQLRAQVEQLTAANAVAQRELLSLQAHLQEAQDGTAKLRAAVEEREKVVEGLRAQVAAAVEAAPAATGQHEEEIRQLQQQLAAVTAGSANVRSLGAEQQGSVEQLSEKLAEAEARLMAAEEDAQTAAARCAELERQLAEERRVAAAWQADLKDRLQQSESRLDEAVRLLQEQQQSQAEAGPSGSGPPLADNAFPESAAGFVLVAYDIENVRPPIGIGLNSILGYIRREFIGEGTKAPGSYVSALASRLLVSVGTPFPAPEQQREPGLRLLKGLVSSCRRTLNLPSYVGTHLPSRHHHHRHPIALPPASSTSQASLSTKW